ncbi:MAG: HlyD family efflux transporter periplasmic adaptor subunit [Burkholderiaceae bacterium]
MTATLFRPGAAAGPATSAPPETARHHDDAQRILQVFDAMLSARTLPAAATALCTGLAAGLGARRVALGWCDGDRCAPIGVSGQADARLPAGLADALQAVMFEAIDQAVIVDSAADGADAPITQMTRALARDQHDGRVITVPVGRDGRARGAITVEWPTDVEPPARVVPMLAAAGHLAADLLPLIERDGLPRWRRVLAAPASTGDRDGGGARRRRIWLAGSLFAVALAGLAVPLPRSLSAEARVEGAIQRVVAAPMAGYLKDVLVRPGDPVRAGQPLARLGERDLELERLRLGSELAQRQSEKTVALAKADRAAMMIAQARIDEAQAKLDLIDQQLRRMVLEAPIDGVMIDGDQTRAIGAPLERGQPLFTLAPADRYRIVIELDERDIGDAHAGQAGTLALSALPWDTVALTVRRIGSLARVVDGRNVFELEAEPSAGTDASGARMADEAPRLRPGLRGVARLDAPAASLGQRLLRRAASSGRRWWWRWSP